MIVSVTPLVGLPPLPLPLPLALPLPASLSARFCRSPEEMLAQCTACRMEQLGVSAWQD